MLLSGCLLEPEPQTLDSPCLGQPATDGGRCPAYAADADCKILTNPCQPSANCLPRAGNWAVTLEGCDVQHTGGKMIGFLEPGP